MKRYFLIFLSLVIFISCKKKIELSDFELYDQSEVFTENRFAVVARKYLTSLDIPSDEGISVSHLRVGEIFDVQETRIVKSNSEDVLWVKINDGWVLSSDVQLYNSFDKAKTASKELLN